MNPDDGSPAGQPPWSGREQATAGGELSRREVPPSGASAAGVLARWILRHLIAEYARRNGHADLLRERIDGRTGE